MAWGPKLIAGQVSSKSELVWFNLIQIHLENTLKILNFGYLYLKKPGKRKAATSYGDQGDIKW